MNPVQGINLVPQQLTPATSETAKAQTSFGSILNGMISNAEQQQQNTDLAIQQLHSGGEKNLHEAMITMEQADISLRYLVQVRNKALEAYQEIMRIQV